MLEFLSLLPILTVGLLLVVMRLPASRAMPVSYLVVVALALGVWRVPGQQVIAASLHGLITAATLLYIIFGALLLLNTLEESGGLSRIRRMLASVTPDRRVQVIIIAWTFGSFMEGAAGFGTPAAVAVPLLVGIGFPALAAVISGLIIQSTPVSFGAVGTPIRVGVARGLGDDPGVMAVAEQLGHADLQGLLAQIARQVATLHALTGALIPLLLVVMMTRYFGPRRSWSDGLRVWRFALFSAAAMIVPYWMVAQTLGPEFPSLLGGLIGLVLVVGAARHRLFLPADEPPWDFAPREEWPAHWSGSIDVRVDDSGPPRVGALAAWSPYVLVGVLLVVTRLEFVGLGAWLRSVNWGPKNILGTSISSDVQVLYSPGTIFVLVSLVTFLLHRISRTGCRAVLRRSLRAVVAASTALVFTVPMVQVFINSDAGTAGYDKMPRVLAEGIAQLAGDAWPLIAPLVGGLGAFVAGSNTVSNMMFSLFQFDVAERIGFDPTWGVALQAVGGAAGNMICVHNVVAASAVVGLLGREGTIIRATLPPFLYYAALPGALGFAIVWHAGRGWVNAGSFIALSIWTAVLVVILLARRVRTRSP